MRYYNEAIAMTNDGLCDYTNNDVSSKCQENMGVGNEVCVCVCVCEWGGERYRKAPKYRKTLNYRPKGIQMLYVIASVRNLTRVWMYDKESNNS